MGIQSLLLFSVLISIGLRSECSFAAPEEFGITKDTSPELKKVQEEDEANIFRHRDIYFIMGHKETKLQFSLKLRPLESKNLYFAYTQQGFWNLDHSSSPFHDVNYNPEAYYEWHLGEGFFRAIHAGIEHRSNGKAGADSRSYDRAVGEVLMALPFWSYEMLWNVKFYRLYDIDWVHNRDIADYMGWWSTTVVLQGVDKAWFPRKAELDLTFYPGGANGNKIERGAFEADLKYRFRLLGFMPYLMFQYYYGYMESMLDYNVKTHSYRAGFMF